MRMTWIEPGVLAATSVPYCADDVRSLHEQGIRAILSLTEHPLTTFRDINEALFQELDIVYHHSPIEDFHAPDDATALDIIAFIEAMKAEKRPVLVHCHAGIGRTGTALHLYYLSQGLTLEEAATMVERRRRINSLLEGDQWDFLESFAERYADRFPKR